MNLGKNVNIVHHIGYFAAGQTAKTTAILDMSGYDGVIFIAQFGTILENGTLTLTVLGDTDSAGATMAAYTAAATAHTVTAATAAYTAPTCMWVDVYRPTKRYIEATITPAVANAVLLGITSIQYSGRKDPQTVVATEVLASNTVASPA